MDDDFDGYGGDIGGDMQGSSGSGASARGVRKRQMLDEEEEDGDGADGLSSAIRSLKKSRITISPGELRLASGTRRAASRQPPARAAPASTRTSIPWVLSALPSRSHPPHPTPARAPPPAQTSRTASTCCPRTATSSARCSATGRSR